jgi:hypothetical protein
MLLQQPLLKAFQAAHPPSWHRPLVTVPKHRLEMADAIGFASLSPRQGIICPTILGQ